MTTTKSKRRKKSRLFLSFLDDQVSLLDKNRQLGTARNYKYTRNSFSEYLNGRKLYFKDFTESLAVDYERWLKKRGLVRNATSFYMRVLRAVYNKAVEARIVNQTFPFARVYTGVDSTRKRAVDEEVIAKLKALQLETGSSLFYVRDLFLFSFYSRGMTFIDMAYLKKHDVRNGIMQYVRHKTQQAINVRIEICMQEIMERYSNKTVRSAYVFPIVTTLNDDRAYQQYRNALSYYNKQLKKLSVLLGISISLSSYVSRHTWATVARDKNIPIAVISAGMGHTSQQTTQIYLASLRESVVDEANLMIISGIGVQH